jgi:hypothetical protein
MNWELTTWDGNKSLNFSCWRKKFGRGHVSVGIGDFYSVTYSFGPNSDFSCSSTRWRKDRILEPSECMAIIDARIADYLRGGKLPI